MSKQVILVTGASSGFGLMTAQSLAQAGHTVYASMRETEGRNAPQVAAIAAWTAEPMADLRTVELDVQSETSAHAVVAAVIADTGRLDVIVHNAGHMVFGPAEAFTPDQYIEQYDVNVLGAQRVNRAALPHLRGQGRGLLVWAARPRPAEGRRRFWRPISRPRRRWTPWPSPTPPSLLCGASRPRSWSPAPSPRGPTTLPTAASRRTPPGPPNMRPAPMRASPTR